MNKKKIVLFIIVTLAILGTLLIIVNLFEKINPSYLIFDRGDNLSKLAVLDINDKNTTITFEKENTFIFYVNKNCNPCREKLGSISLILNIFKEESMDFIILWEDEIPYSLIEKYNIDKKINYKLKNKERIATYTPSYFYIGKGGALKFQTDDFGKILNKIYICSDKVLLEKQVKDLLSDNKLLLLTIEDCLACKDILKSVENNEDKFNKYKTLIVSSDYDAEEYDILDTGNVLSKIFNISTYPATVYMEGESILVNEEKYSFE